MTDFALQPRPAPPDPEDGRPTGATAGPVSGDAPGLVTLAPGACRGPQARPARRLALDWGPPLLLYGVACALQLGLLALLRQPGSPELGRVLLGWDARLFLDVAQHGYPAPGAPRDLSGAWLGSNLAFFPVFPAAIRLVHLATGASFGDAALAVSRVAGAVAVVLLYQLFGRLYDRRTGLFMVLLTVAQPMAVVLGMGYSEAVFLACAVGALLAAHRERWPAAAAWGVLAGLTRPSGLAVGAAVALAAWLTIHQRKPWVRPLVSALVACSATPGYLLWVGLRTGRADGWFRIQQAGWGTALDWGAHSWDYVTDQLTGGTGWVDVSIALLVLAALGGSLLALLWRPWPPLALYGLLVTALAIGQSDYSSCKPRLLVPALLFLLPGAVALARARGRVAWPVAGAALLAGSWYGAYLLGVWQSVI
ncbi:glycosyltransferase family 39 protein [Kitasatospora sp. NBC_01302]|uniref:glycosyltransferase family 39 protein n=1 Tax=Kitasatospora sp. NBC_01302 TaxID=2903575 RepID=UPI002E10619A|nr:glycosyltransferase family 39 protein [Kitasatospora sp. NBC_01302]